MTSTFGGSSGKARRRQKSTRSRVRRPSWQVTLRAEALEDRFLPSLTPSLLLDINPGAADSSARQFTQVNNQVFFTSIDGAHGRELWVSNGSAAGTSLVKDINPGGTGSYPVYLTNLNGTLFFNANDGTHGVQIWGSDGTQAGTFLLTDINPGVPTGSPFGLTNVNGSLFFAANDGTGGSELFASNGVAAGTFEFRHRSSEAISYGSLTNVNGTLFFVDNTGSGNQLWESNGTNAGTFPLPAFGPQYLTDVSGTLFFRSGGELWESNGTAAGTFLVKDINPGGPSSYIYYPVNANGTLFFLANDGTHGFELWESNGAATGTSLVADINPGSASSFPQYLTNVNGTVFFQANDGAHGKELWESNGSAAGTLLVDDINPGAANGYARNLANGNGTLFFEANDGTHGFELWASNGSAAGTFLVADINPSTTPGINGSYPSNLANAGGALFFAANDGTHGVEPWVLIPSSTSVTSSPNPAAFGQTVIFTATVTAVLGLTPSGTVDFKEGSTDLTPGDVSMTAGQATFSTSSLALGSHTITAVYVSDGDLSGSQGDDSASPQVVQKAAGTPTVTSSLDPAGLGQAVTFTATVPFAGSVPPTGTVDFKEGSTDLTPGGMSLTAGQATFSTNSLALGSHTITAFYSGDGSFTTGQGDDSANPEIVLATALEPRLLTFLDPRPPMGSFPPFEAFGGFTQVNNLVFFPATSGGLGNELWASNGTTPGTFLVKDIIPGPGSSYPKYLTNVNGTLFFAADFPSSFGPGTTAIYRSNGTAAGTVPMFPPPLDLNPHHLTNVSGTLFFDAADQLDQQGHLTNQRGLWTSNGTPAGTSRVADPFPGNDPKISYLTNVNGTLFFAANDGILGSQLWESNGSAAGTFRVTGINPPHGLDPYSLTNVNGTLFFSGQGRLWESNGTIAGTFLLPAALRPKYLTNVNGTLFFSAVDNNGTELWESTGTAGGTFLVKDINPGIGGSYPTYLTNVNGTVFFSANDELWESNGTAAGTSLVKPGVLVRTNRAHQSAGGKYSSLTNVNGTLFFSGDDGTHGAQLWASNGSAAGTFMVQDINQTGNLFSQPYSLTNANGALFFVADEVAPWILIPSSTSVSSSPNPAAFGQPVTFTATVGKVFDLTATGTVDFKEGSTDLTPGGVSLTNGQATFSTSTLGLGSHTITALYSGDSNFPAIDGDDSANPEIVQKDSTSVSLLINPSTLVSGQSVAFAAVVANTSGPFGFPSGQVQFAVDGTNLGPPISLFIVPVASHLPTALLAAGGPHTITATYTNSDGHFVGSSKSATQAVAKDGTKTILTSITSAVSGQVVVFTATVIAAAPGSGTPTGTVDFKEGATDLTPGGVTMTAGKAIFSTSSLALGSHTVTASYAGDANFTGSSGNDASAPVVVNKASTRTVMTSFPDPSVFGQAVSFTVAVIALFPSQGTPTGTVAFTDGTTTIGSATLNGVGRATFTIASLSRGNHAINANYAGDAKFLASSDVSFGETVQKDATTTTVTASANPAVVGTTVTFTATIQASSPGAGIPTGAVSFLDITTTLGTGTLNAAGKATFTTSALALGTHAIKATYGGDNNFLTSVSAILAETVKSMAQRSALAGMGGAAAVLVSQSATTTTLTSSPNPAAFGQAVAFTATVTSGAPGTPTGTVDFKEGSTDLTPGGVSLSSGQATFSTSSLVAGSHTITAFYSGDASFSSSHQDDSGNPQVVQKDSTFVSGISTGPVSGQPLAFVAFVTNTSGPFGSPTGQVQFAVNGTNLGPPVMLVGGAALSLPTKLFPSGSPYTISAIYTNTDGNFIGGSLSFRQGVAKDGTKTILISTPTSAVSGQVVVFTATINPVAPGSGTPTGTVDFKDGATDLTPGGISLSAGRAFFSTSSLGLGSHTVTASYRGDANFTGSSGNDLNSLVINQASTRTVMTSFPDPAVFGQAVSFTVAVSALFPSQGTPTGTVSFTDGTTTIGSVTLNGVGRATFTTASLSLGNHAINANYGGDARFKVSSDTGFGETVQKDSTTTTVTASANPAVVGTTITFTAALQANNPGAGTPTGTVTFLDITTTLGTGTLNAAGQATFTTSALALGTHAITANYAGDNNFLASASPTLAETVKSSAAVSSALAFSAVPPDPVGGTDKSALTTPSAEAQGVKGPILPQTGAAAPTAATSDPSRLDRYFAAVTNPSFARPLGLRATPKHDPADWLEDPFLLT
jgi:ELWxxDGT repeat protein